MHDNCCHASSFKAVNFILHPFLYSFNESTDFRLGASFLQIFLVQLRGVPYSIFFIFNTLQDEVERLLVRTRVIILGVSILDDSIIHEVTIASFVVPEENQTHSFVRAEKSIFLYKLEGVHLNLNEVTQ